MSTTFKEHRLPIVLSIAALLLATVIGLVPVMQKGKSSATTTDVSTLEKRLAEVEAALALGVQNEPNAATALPANMMNSRLRQEIDLITRGLGNQTGRVTRLQSALSELVGPDGKPAVPALVVDEISLAKRGLANLTRRMNRLENRFDELETAAVDITRLQQQMANVDHALLQLSSKLSKVRAGSDLSAATVTTNAGQKDPTLVEIQGKLDAILLQLKN